MGPCNEVKQDSESILNHSCRTTNVFIVLKSDQVSEWTNTYLSEPLVVIIDSGSVLCFCGRKWEVGLKKRRGNVPILLVHKFFYTPNH